MPVARSVLHTVVVVVEIGVETDVHEVGWAQGGIEPDAGVAGGTDVERLREGYYAAEAVAVGNVGEGACVVTVGVVPSGEAYGAEVVEVAFPAEFEVVGIAITQIGVAGAVAVVIVDGEACDLGGGRWGNVVGVAEGEVVHGFGAVAGVDGGTEVEELFADVAAVGFRVSKVVPCVVGI